MTDREKIKEALEAVVALKVYLSCQPITCVCRLNSAPCCYCSNRTEAREQAEKLKSVLTDLSASQAATKPAGGEWLPIESALKDGTAVEVFDHYATNWEKHEDGRYIQTGNDGFGIVVARFDKAHGWHVAASVANGKYIALTNPTHWQPLPAPPLTRKENGE